MKCYFNPLCGSDQKDHFICPQTWIVTIMTVITHLFKYKMQFEFSNVCISGKQLKGMNCIGSVSSEIEDSMIEKENRKINLAVTLFLTPIWDLECKQ